MSVLPDIAWNGQEKKGCGWTSRLVQWLTDWCSGPPPPPPRSFFFSFFQCTATTPVTMPHGPQSFSDPQGEPPPYSHPEHFQSKLASPPPAYTQVVAHRDVYGNWEQGWEVGVEKGFNDIMVLGSNDNVFWMLANGQWDCVHQSFIYIYYSWSVLPSEALVVWMIDVFNVNKCVMGCF